MNIKSYIKATKIILFLLLATLPLILKIRYVNCFLTSFTGLSYLWGIQVFSNDAPFYIALIALFYLSYLSKMPHIVSITVRCIALLLFFVYIVDYYLLTNFNTHLIVNDAQKYASYSLKYLYQIHSGKQILYLCVAVTLVGFVIPFILSRYKINKKAIHGLFVLPISVLFLISISSFNANAKYVHSWMYKNVIDHNLMILSEGKDYSDEFVNSFKFNEDTTCYSKTSENRNIILLMVESLSSYQSKFFSGVKDWTPKIDAIAGQNIAYLNFYANGFTTEDAEIALLTGKLPIFKPSSYSRGGGLSFKGFYGIKDSLPNILKKNGYATEYLTTADLEFSDTGNWARSIGFDHIEGHEHPYYDNWDRFHFKAAPDEALYNRVLDRIEKNNNNDFFIFVKTASTHHPFINPETKNRSEAEAFQYVDKQLGNFYDQLKREGFFEKGILIIVGDHHAMVPLKKEEIDAFGPLKGVAKVPMIVSYGDKAHYVEDDQYQQTDMFNSLKGTVSDHQCYSIWIGDIFGSKAPKYILHRRGDNRNIISVFSKEKDASIMLDGDDTRVISGHFENTQINDLIVNKINSVRISKNGKEI